MVLFAQGTSPKIANLSEERCDNMDIVQRISRRRLLAGAAGAGAFILAGGALKGAGLYAAQNGNKRVLRFAHFTDMHMEPTPRAVEGLTAALRHAQDVSKAEMIITGGDNVMDSAKATQEQINQQWDCLSGIMKKECSIPVKYCIGNHDVWGFRKEESKVTGNEPLWGKAMTIHQTKMPERYYSFEKNGWRFIVLDSMYLDDDAPQQWIAKLDDRQMEWLKTELAANKKMPTVIVSHNPIVTVCGYDRRQSQEFQIAVSGLQCHYDGPQLVALFRQHPQVKLCLGGHTHDVDRIDYKGVTYICDGAVCSDRWKAASGGGYGLVDLYDDGTFEHEYIRLDKQQSDAG